MRGHALDLLHLLGRRDRADHPDGDVVQWDAWVLFPKYRAGGIADVGRELLRQQRIALLRLGRRPRVDHDKRDPPVLRFKTMSTTSVFPSAILSSLCCWS